MDLQVITNFFLWCTVINGVLFSFWMIMFVLFPDTVYRTQSRWFAISREHFDTIIYAFFGLFKILFLIFNVVPYVVLRIIA